MIVFPQQRYKQNDKVAVDCDSNVSPYCKKRALTTYYRYKVNVRSHGGRYVCNQCALVEKYGVSTEGMFLLQKFFRNTYNLLTGKEDEIK